MGFPINYQKPKTGDSASGGIDKCKSLCSCRMCLHRASGESSSNTIVTRTIQDSTSVTRRRSDAHSTIPSEDRRNVRPRLNEPDLQVNDDDDDDESEEDENENDEQDHDHEEEENNEENDEEESDDDEDEEEYDDEEDDNNQINSEPMVWLDPLHTTLAEYAEERRRRRNRGSQNQSQSQHVEQLGILRQRIMADLRNETSPDFVRITQNPIRRYDPPIQVFDHLVELEIATTSSTRPPTNVSSSSNVPEPIVSEAWILLSGRDGHLTSQLENNNTPSLITSGYSTPPPPPPSSNPNSSLAPSLHPIYHSSSSSSARYAGR